MRPLQHYFYIMLINLLQGTYKPNPWYFPHNFDIAATEEKNIYIQNVVHFMSCHVMPLLASGRHKWRAGVVIICTIPCIFIVGIVEITFSQKWPRLDLYLVTVRIDYRYNEIGVLRGQQQIPSILPVGFVCNHIIVHLIIVYDYFSEVPVEMTFHFCSDPSPSPLWMSVHSRWTIRNSFSKRGSRPFAW